MSCKNQFKSFSQIKLLCKSQVLSFHAPEVAYISMQSSSALLSGYPGNHCVKEILFPLLLQTNSDSVISSLPPIHTEHSQGFNWHVSTWKVNKNDTFVVFQSMCFTIQVLTPLVFLFIKCYASMWRGHNNETNCLSVSLYKQ